MLDEEEEGVLFTLYTSADLNMIPTFPENVIDMWIYYRG